MKTIILTLMLIVNIFATNYYIDRDATGNNTGENWANAWLNLNNNVESYSGQSWAISGGTFSAGDTIYFSGGTDSTSYFLEKRIFSSPQGTKHVFSTPVVLCPSWETGHNGDVYFINNSTSTVTETKNLWVRDVCNIEFVNFIIWTQITPDMTLPAPKGGLNNTFLENADSIKFTNCILRNNGTGGALSVEGTGTVIYNTILENMENHSSRDQDVFTVGAGNGGLTMMNSSVIQRNNYTGINVPYENQNIYTDNGVNMTVTTTSLTDTDLNMEHNYHAGSSIWVDAVAPGEEGGLYTFNYTNNESGQIDSNNANTFYFHLGWQGATPSNGMDWSVNTTAHRDLVQINNSGAVGKLTTTIQNSFFRCIEPTATRWNQTFYLTGSNSGCDSQYYFFINNLVVMDVAERRTGAITSVSDCDTFASRVFNIYNNTFITPSGSLYLNLADTVRTRNNIFISTDVHSLLTTWAMVIGANDTDVVRELSMADHYIDVDYNHYYFPSWSEGLYTFQCRNPGIGGQYQRSWGTWQNEHNNYHNGGWVHTDEHSDTGYVSLVNIIDSVAISYIPPVELRDIGADVSGIFTTDCNGDPRVVNGITDLGFWEFQGEAPKTKMIIMNR